MVSVNVLRSAYLRAVVEEVPKVFIIVVASVTLGFPVVPGPSAHGSRRRSGLLPS